MVRRVEIPRTSINELRQRWPDARLLRIFRELLQVFEGVVESRLGYTHDKRAAVREGYRLICEWVICHSSHLHAAPINDGYYNRDRTFASSLVERLRREYDGDWLQAMASLLGMLMHFSVGQNETQLLRNERRPQKLSSTYPNSPALARFVGELAVARMLKHPLPDVCRRDSDAERYAELALNFRVLDPSMESGQLLAEFAATCVRRVQAQHPPSSRTGRRLIRAVLEKLCRDCLWGIDRNELATDATRVLFLLLCAELGVEKIVPRNLLNTNSLESFSRGNLSQFDCVINNPPWGETLSPQEKSILRGDFTALTCLDDTYVAFSELALRCLRPGGAFVVVLPSQVTGTRNAFQLRKLLAETAVLDRLALLPRAAFAEATVRGLVLAGRVRPTKPPSVCRVSVFPVVKSFDATLVAKSYVVPTSGLRGAGANALSLLINARSMQESSCAGTIRLEQVAAITTGVQLYSVGRGCPPQTAETVRAKPFNFKKLKQGTVPAIRGRDVHAFKVGKPREFICFDDRLAGVGQHRSLFHRTRVFLREICRRDGKMTAAVVGGGVVPLHGVLTAVPEFIDAFVLAGILNSTAAAEYVRHNTASFTKVDFQKITVGELRRMPIPRAAVANEYRNRIGLAPASEREASLHERLSVLSRELSADGDGNESTAQGLIREMNRIVTAMYERNGEPF